MKIKGLLISMLACTAMLVGCSDDAIDNIAQENNELKSDVKGYLAISISPGSNSSRGLYDNAFGDTHTSADDNGHHNSGTAEENKVNEIMVVIKSNANEYSKLYSTTTGSNGSVANEFTPSNNGQVYTMKNPFEVELGTYKTLVIVNPNDGIKSLRTAANPSTEGKTQEDGVSLYDNILNYQVNEGGETAKTLPTAIDLVTGEKRDNFMMTNREELKITVTTSNSAPEYAAGMNDEVEVERVVSKITFRPNDNSNIYNVPFVHYTMTGVKKDGWKSDVTDKTDENKSTLIKYISGENEVWKAEDEKFYTLSVDENDNNIFTLMTPQPTNAEIYYEKTSTTDSENWYIKLNRYALINLSKDLYAVRHIGSSTYDNTTGVQIMGKLTDKTGNYPYLVDPVSTEKNDVTWTTEGNWQDGFDSYNNWFFNPWETIKDITTNYASEDQTYFINLPGSITDGSQNVNTEHNGINQIGQHLSYCFENAVKQYDANGNDLQTVGLSTAIVFEAQIYTDETCTTELNQPLYQYEGNVYTSIADIKTLYGKTNDTEWTAVVDGADDAVIEAKGIKIYDGGKCYYYTSQIKHYDDGNNTTNGVMEFAIMRNNIYSLAVTGIQNIGDANLEGFNPADPDESSTAYIQVNAKILPWIVRFTDIEF